MERIEVKFAEADVKANGEFAGYGAVFGNVDSHGDVITPGAFKTSLAEWSAKGRLPPMLIQHGGMGLTEMAGVPVGIWESMSEDNMGLQVKGRIINLDTERSKTIYGAMKEGAMGGLSIGYRAKKSAPGDIKLGSRRILQEIGLYEVSIVAEPSNEKAGFSYVKSAHDIKTIRDFEEALVNGTLPAMPLKDAKALIAEGFKALRWTERDAGSDGDEMAEIIRRNIARLKS
jgi:HK97 family phage prohead protease